MAINDISKLKDFDELSREFSAGDFVNNNLLEGRFIDAVDVDQKKKSGQGEPRQTIT